MGVTDLDELSGKWKMRCNPLLCCYMGDDVDFWDPVMMAKELGCRMDELLVYYGGDLWNPDGSDFGYSDYYDDQSELSDYEDPKDFFRDESCEFHSPDGSYFSISEVGKASSPVSGYTAGMDVEVSVTLVRLQQDSGDASVPAVKLTFWTPPPPPPLLSGLRGATNPGPSDVLRAGEGFAVRSFANFGR